MSDSYFTFISRSSLHVIDNFALLSFFLLAAYETFISDATAAPRSRFPVA